MTPDTMGRMDLLELAERCEAAAENDFELLEDAFRLCFPRPDRIWVTNSRGDWTPEYSEWQDRQWKYFEFVAAKAYLDAALTLVPEGYTFSLYGDGCAGVSPIGHPDDLPTADCEAATPALALCAAALRARAAMEKE